MSIVSLHEVTYVTADGRALFETLDLTFGLGRCGLIGRNGVGKSTLLKLLSGELVPTAGSISRNGVTRVLQQQVGTDAGVSVAAAFGVAEPLERLSRALAGTATMEDLAEVDWTIESRLTEALDRVGLEGLDPGRRLATLSGGQRTRLALAALTFDEPDIVLLDEPTNNLDRAGRALVTEVLARFPGAAIVVSHDRELLEGMDRIVELSGLGVRAYGGNWSFYAERQAEVRAAAVRKVTVARHGLAQVERKIAIARQRKASRDAAGRKQNKRGGDDQMWLDYQAGRAENSLGQGRRLAERQRAAAAQALEEAEAQLERIKTPSVALPSSHLSSRRTVLAFEGVTGGYQHPIFSDLSFSIVGPERVAVTGANGAGKSTLVKLALGRLAPLKGTVHRPVRAVMLDQEVSLLDHRSSVLDNFRRLNPGDSANSGRAALARFLFRADAALCPVKDLSGGEVLRAGLACVLGGEDVPELLVLDEPTNHLDIDSLAAVEAGLNGFDGALLVISHDQTFLDAIGIQRRLEL